MRISVLLLALSSGCIGLLPQGHSSSAQSGANLSHEQGVHQSTAIPSSTTEGSQALHATAKDGAPTSDLVDLNEFIGSNEFGECDGQSLGGDSMCWDYGIRLTRAPDGNVTATLDGGGYQMASYTIHLKPEPTTKQKAAVALRFERFSDDTEDPPTEFAAGDLVGVLAKRDGRMCFAFSKLKSATGAKFLCGD